MRTLLLFCLCTITSFAQQSGTNSGIVHIRKQSIEAHLEFLSSDALEGRQAGKTGGRAAAEYIKSILLSSGISPFLSGSYFQTFEAYSPAREKGVDFQVHPDSIISYKRLSSYRRLSLQNVLGYIEGKRKDEYIVIGAHYDHLGVDEFLVGDKIYNGADDNASGVAALLQIAQAISASGEQPLRSIILAFWDGEEVNYLGSEYFVETFPNPSSIKANINLDMISRDGLMPILYPQFKIPEANDDNTAKANQFHLLYTDELTETGEQLKREILNHKLNITPKPSVIAHKSRGSDYLAFSLRSIPILWFFTGLHPDYHTPADEASRIDKNKLVDITKATYLSLIKLANEE